jgi:hypothetical protein
MNDINLANNFIINYNSDNNMYALAYPLTTPPTPYTYYDCKTSPTNYLINMKLVIYKKKKKDFNNYFSKDKKW